MKDVEIKIGEVKHITIDFEKIQIHLEKDSICYYVDVDMKGRTPIIDILKNVWNEEEKEEEKEEREENEEFDMDCDSCPLYDAEINCRPDNYDDCIYDTVHKHIKGKL